MDMDFFEDFIDENKRKDTGKRENHRWTEVETNKLLRCIATMLKEGAQYEQPVARLFYEKLKHKYYADCNLSHLVLKNKMRHLKASYMKAVEWKDTVGQQLYDSDQKHVNARIRSICPHYNLLDEIFGPISNSDPIGFRLPETKDGEENTFNGYIIEKAHRAKRESTEALIVPKMEAFNDERCDVEDETLDEINDEYDESYNETRHSSTNFTNYNIKVNKSKAKHKSAPTSIQISLEEKKFLLEKQRFQFEYVLQKRRMSLEEKKHKFEIEKFEQMQRMRKYEIDKQFLIKKQEIESNERLKLLEMGKSAEVVTAEVEEIPFVHDATTGETAAELEE